MMKLWWSVLFELERTLNFSEHNCRLCVIVLGGVVGLARGKFFGSV